MNYFMEAFIKISIHLYVSSMDGRGGWGKKKLSNIQKNFIFIYKYLKSMSLTLFRN